MQAIFIGRVTEAFNRNEASPSSSPSTDCILPLHEYELTITQMALYHAPTLYNKMARLLSSKGLLVCPDHSRHSLIVLIHDSWNSIKGLKMILSWLTPLLPAQPKSVKKHSRLSQSNVWEMRLQTIIGQRDGEFKPVDIGQTDEWSVTVDQSKQIGVSNVIISACIEFRASLSLYRQGWSRLGGPSFGRFIQIPNGLQSKATESCIQAMIELTLTQQSEIVIGIKVETVKFQPMSALVEEGTNMTERTVKTLPDLENAIITQTVGNVTQSTSAKSLGVDRNVWLESHGYTLPANFTVVQVMLEGEFSFSTIKSTLPLCCCLASDVEPVRISKRDQETRIRREKQHQQAIEEIASIIRLMTVAMPNSPDGASDSTQTEMLSSLEKQSATPLMDAINPSSTSSRFSSQSLITTSAVFQSGRSLMTNQSLPTPTKTPKVKLTLPPSRRKQAVGVTIDSVKKSIQLSNHPSSWAGSNGFSSSLSSVATADSSSVKESPIMPSDSMEDVLPVAVGGTADSNRLKKNLSFKNKTNSSSLTSTPSKRSFQPAQSPAKSKSAAMSASASTKSKQAITSNQASSTKRQKTSNDRNPSKANSKPISWSSSAKKLTASSLSQAPWVADFSTAFLSEVTLTADAIQMAHKFRQTAAPTTERKEEVEQDQKSYKPHSAVSKEVKSTSQGKSSKKRELKQAKLNFKAV